MSAKTTNNGRRRKKKTTPVLVIYLEIINIISNEQNGFGSWPIRKQIVYTAFVCVSFCVNRLTETSAGVAEQLQSTRQMAEDLIDAQSVALQAQQEILNNGEELKVTLKDSTQGKYYVAQNTVSNDPSTSNNTVSL